MMLGALVVTAALAAVVVGRRVLWSCAGVRAVSDRDLAVWRRPLVWLGVVVAVLFVNQILCTVYILRVHGGDPSFIADHLPPGWFNLADDNHLLRGIAEWWPAPEALAVTVLRVPALLELPFAILAYLTIVWWADRELCRRVVESPLVWVASVAYSATFCLIELALPNPYTASDLVLRALSGVVTPLLLRRMAGGDHTDMRDDVRVVPVSLMGFAALVVCMGALGVLVLAVYDTVLLYNLQHLPSWGLAGAAALAVLITTHLAATQGRRPTAGPTTASLISAAHRFLVLFFAPALSIRYILAFGSVAVGLTATLVIGVVALGGAIRNISIDADGTARLATTTKALAGRVSLCVAVGAVAGVAGLSWDGRHLEQSLLVAAVAATVGALSTAVLLDALTPGRLTNHAMMLYSPRRSHDLDEPT